jgi:hypothetical protein
MTSPDLPHLMNQQRDYFAEMYVAGILADRGWNIYFPRRDIGFDFIITKQRDDAVVVRPVQVKGKYPSEEKRDATFYGYIGRFSQLHPDMLLAIPYFPTDRLGVAPVHIAWMPRSRIKPQASAGYQCVPACFRDGNPVPRRDYVKYFDAAGLEFMESRSWK